MTPNNPSRVHLCIYGVFIGSGSDGARKEEEMECIKMGEIWFFTTLTDPESLRYARAFAWYARELWKKLCRKEDPKAVRVPVILHRDDKIKPGTCTRYVPRLDLLAVCVDLQTVTKMAVRLSKQKDPTERGDSKGLVLRVARLILAEELHHLWRIRLGQASRPRVHITSNRLPSWEALIVYYAEDPEEYGALQFVVEVTGERRELLEAVEAYRAERYIS